MEIKAKADELSDALYQVKPVFSSVSGTTLNILNYVLLENKGEQIKIVGTNLDNTVITQCGCKSSEEGKVLVPFDNLYHTVSKTDNQWVEISENKKSVTVSSEGYSVLLDKNSPKDFPSVPSLQQNKDSLCRLDSEILQEMISSIQPSLGGAPDGRENLNSVFLTVDQENGSAIMVSTDGVRLSKYECSKDELLGDNIPDSILNGITIPKDSVDLLEQSIDPSEGGVFVGKEDDKMVFLHSDVICFSRDSKADYPDWRKIIPDNDETSLSVDNSELDRALKIAQIFSDKKRNHLTRLELNEDKLNVYTQNPNKGEMSVDIFSESIEGNDIPKSVSFNRRFLDDISSNIEGDVIATINGNDNPSVFRDTENDSVTYFVMPLTE